MPMGALCISGCCCCAPDEWEADFAGFLKGNPWFQIEPWKVAIYFEDSANCVTGGNPNIQSGTAKKCLIVDSDSESGQVEYKVTLTGRIEKQSPGFERITVKFIKCEDDTTAHTVTDVSDKDGGGCTMEDRTKEDVFLLPVGSYKVLIKASTNDGLFHVGAFWQVEIVRPNP